MDIIKDDLKKVFDKFYYSEFYDHLNNSFISLIPKKMNAKELKVYHPISLLSSVYMIISKTLHLRLKMVMKGIISQPQGSFIEGRKILDGVLIANECIKDRRISRRSNVICKVNLEKAYDHHVNWSFLDYTLERMDFWGQMEKLDVFYIRCHSEVLSKMIKKTEMGFFRGFKMGSRGVSLSHLQFANDNMIFCNVYVRQLGYLICIFKCFEVVLSLNIELAMSENFQVGEECDIENLAWILGCKIRSLSSSFLGMPLGAHYKSKVV